MGNEVIEVKPQTVTLTVTTSILNTITMTAAPSNGVVVDYTGEMVIIVLFIILSGAIVILLLLYRRRVYKHQDNKNETRINKRLGDA